MAASVGQRFSVESGAQPTFMLAPYVNEYKKIQYAPDCITKVAQLGPQVSKWLKLVSYKASWEP